MIPIGATIAGYRATRYVVFDDSRRIEVVIGTRDARLDQWLAGRGARSATIVTAWNPAGQRCPAPRNARAQARLRRRPAPRSSTGFSKSSSAVRAKLQSSISSKG